MLNIKSWKTKEIWKLEKIKETHIKITDEQLFSVLNDIWYEKIKDKLSQNSNGYSYKEVLKELWEEKASMFFYWYVLFSDVDLSKKESFLYTAIDLEYYEEFFKIFSERQFRDFAFFVADNNLIDRFYSKLKGYLKYLGKDLFQKKYVHLFIIYTESFEKEYVNDIVDFILDNMEVIYDSLEKIETSWKYKNINNFTNEKANFDSLITTIFQLTPTYSLSKLNSLDTKQFIFATQNLLIEAINNFFTLENIKEIFKSEDKQLKAELKIFIDRLWELWLENIKLNFTVEYNKYAWNYKTNNKENNYFNVLLEYKKEIFEQIDIQDILWKNANLPNFIFENKNFEKIFQKKFLETQNINYWDLIQNPWFVSYTDYDKELENVLLSNEIINHIAQYFSEQEKINFIIFLRERTHLFHTFIDEENNFLWKVFNNKKIENILNNSDVVDFISLFSENFTSFDSIVNSEQIKTLLWLGYWKLKKINTILDFSKKVKNIKFKVKLEDIDSEFIDFILNSFYFDSSFTKGGILSYDLEKLNNFFDVEVDSLDFFGSNTKKENNWFIAKIKNKFKKDEKIPKKKKNESFQIQDSLGNSTLVSNLEEILNLYNLEFKLSNLFALEKNFNSFLWNKNNVYLSSFLWEDYFEDLKSVLKYFQKYQKKDLSINEFLLVLTETDKIDLEYVELLNENLSDFDAKNLIKIDWNIVSSDFDYINKIKYLLLDRNSFYYIFELFNWWTKEKLINFLEFYQKIRFVKDINWNNDRSRKFEYVYWEYNELESYKLWTRNKVFLIRYLTQKAIDKNNFLYLNEIINIILQNENYQFDNIDNIDNLEEIIKYNLFAIPSQWSNILLQLLKKLENKVSKKRLYSLENFLSNDLLNQMYQIMKNDIEKFLNKQNLEKKCTMVNQYSKLDISIYLRYGHTVNFPEIWEYIVLFVDTFLEKWYSKYIKNIRLIPRNYKWIYIPRQVFFKNTKNVELYNVSWSKFRVALENDSIPFHLSHSRYKNNFNRPYIISWWMKRNNDKNEIVANFELKKSADFNDTSKISLEQLFKELVSILNITDEKMDRKKWII